MIISINNYFILINKLRVINFHEVTRKSACFIEKNRRDVNMKKISYQIPQREQTLYCVATGINY
jgi:reverse gyrase